jgi:hypothetical protein
MATQIKYWPREIQEEIRKNYTYFPEEGVIHKMRLTKDGWKDTGVCGTYVNTGQYITVMHAGGRQWCIGMSKLAWFLATGEQYRSVKTIDGNPLNLRKDNLLPIGMPVTDKYEEDERDLREKIAKTIAQRNAKSVEKRLEADKVKEELAKQRSESKKAKEGSKPVEEGPGDVQAMFLDSYAFTSAFVDRHEYWNTLAEETKEEQAYLNSIWWVNGIYTGMPWDEFSKWHERMTEETGMLATKYVLEDMGDKDGDAIAELARVGQLTKYEHDFYKAGLALIWHGRGHHNFALGTLNGYTWLGQPWAKTDKVEQYKEAERAIYKKMRHYYELNGVASHEEMVELIHKQANEADKQRTLLNSNKVPAATTPTHSGIPSPSPLATP